MEVEYRYFIYTCNSTARDATLGVLYGYKALLHAATVVMALKTRKVRVKGLDDYREIVLATYVSSFVLVIILVFTYTVADQINLFTVLTSFSLFVGATVIMVLVFVPKVTISSCCCFVACCSCVAGDEEDVVVVVLLLLLIMWRMLCRLCSKV